MKNFIFFMGLCLTALSTEFAAAAAKTPINVAAATSIRPALIEVSSLFERQSGQSVRISTAASGILRRQIARGAPYDLFMSADEQFIFDLAAEGHARDRGSIYARGRLALAVARDQSLPADAELSGLKAFFDSHPHARFAIANPNHAPYGRAAMQALDTLGLAEALKPRVVIGENVSQAAQFVASRSAAAGLISLSLARLSEEQGAIRHAVLPERLHLPINHRMAVLRRAGPETEALFRFILDAAAREVFIRHGFLAPAEKAAE